MPENRTVVVKLYPNKTQEKALLNTLGHCCFLYNHLLEICRNAHCIGELSPSKFTLDKHITDFKKEHTELKEVYAQVLTNISTRVSLAFDGFFKRVSEKKKDAGYPRFKSFSRYDSFTYTQNGFSITPDKLKLSKIGDIRASGFRKMCGTLKTCTVKREGNAPHYRWKAFLTYSFESISTEYIDSSRTPVGIDMGLKDIIVTSDNKRFSNGYYYKQAEKRIAIIQRKMSSFEKDSEEYVKFRQRLYHAFQRMKNVRRAERYDTAREIIENHDIIAIEDISVSKIQQKSLGKEMRKSYMDASWRMTLDTLCIKAAEAGCTVVRVPPAYTSQMCSKCGRLVPKDLSERRHRCICGLDIDRDLNAARNILRLGLQALQSKNCQTERFHKESITALKS